MLLEEYMTEAELQELNLGRLAGGVARGVGAVAGGAVGMWDASKKGFTKGRDAVANYGDQEDAGTTDWRDSEFGQSFGDARANTSGDTAALVDRVVKLIDKLPERDRRSVIAKLQGKSGSGIARREPTGTGMGGTAQQARTSSTGGSISPTDTGLIHRAAPKAPAAKPSSANAGGQQPAAASNTKPAAKPSSANAGGQQPAAASNTKPAATASARPSANATPRNAQKQHPRKQNARRGGKMDESMRASREEIDLFRDEIKNIGVIITMLNRIYDRAKAKGDSDSMSTVKQRIAAKSHERDTLMRQLERRMTPEQFEQIKESLSLD